MTLSVVIPARDAAANLAETLDSLLAQTRTDWQAIIVDDGSTDETRQLAEAYAARDKRFRLLSDGRPAEGVSAARNRGIAAATGRWLSFLDADDWLEPAFIEKMIGAAEAQRGCDVVYCSFRHVTLDGRQGPATLNTRVARAPFETLARVCPLLIHTVVLQRTLAVELGGFDPALRTNEDWDFWQRLARTGIAFHPVPQAVAFYRARRNSLSGNVRKRLADIEVVVERSFGPDPRVPHPAPRHAAGADASAGGTKEMVIAYFALWAAAFEIGEGGDGEGLIKPLPNRWDNHFETCHLNILDGLLRGARLLPGDAFGDDPAFFAAVRRLLQQVERAAGRPGLAQALEFALEPDVFRSTPPKERQIVGRTLFVRQDVRHLQPIEAPDGVDTLNMEFSVSGQYRGRIETPLFGTLSARELTSVAIEAMSPSVFLEASGLLRRPLFWLHAAIELTKLPASLSSARPRRGPKSVFRPRLLARRVLTAAALASASSRNMGLNDRALADLVAEGHAQAAAAQLSAGSATVLNDEPVLSQTNRRAYWDSLYRTPDPMAYGSDYEQLKYKRTLELLPPGPIGRAVEAGCSEGIFSALLAPCVGHLTAVDISQTALQRARERGRAFDNVEYRQLDFFDDELPQELDLLVCSEVLYYLADRTALASVSIKLAAALAPGGHLLVAHGKELKDDPSSTGFDWDGPFGAKIIAETLGATPGLALERSLETDLYRIDLFRRMRTGETPPEPRLDTVELGPSPEPEHARSIVWGGAEARRAEVRLRDSTDRLAILAYHRIAEDGPPGLARYRVKPSAFAAQMRWLRRHGYHAVTSVDLARHLASGRPFEGRPVMISFDDAYRDFHQLAWPILHAHDFRAEVFVVTDRVGGTADWDVEFGPPAPLMDWPEIQTLGAAGIGFGSHMASHSHTAELSSREVVLEAARSRALLERALGTECRAIAAPFGEADDRFVRIAAHCGFTLGLTMEPGLAELTHNPLRLPRIEVMGDWSVETFAHAVRPRS